MWKRLEKTTTKTTSVNIEVIILWKIKSNKKQLKDLKFMPLPESLALSFKSQEFNTILVVMTSYWRLQKTSFVI